MAESLGGGGGFLPAEASRRVRIPSSRMQGEPGADVGRKIRSYAIALAETGWVVRKSTSVL